MLGCGCEQGKLKGRARGNLINLRSTHHSLGRFPSPLYFTTPTSRARPGRACLRPRQDLAVRDCEFGEGRFGCDERHLQSLTATSNPSNNRYVSAITRIISPAQRNCRLSNFPPKPRTKTTPAKTDISAPPQTTPTTHLKPQINRQHG
jgi:hypothetical protein